MGYLFPLLALAWLLQHRPHAQRGRVLVVDRRRDRDPCRQPGRCGGLRQQRSGRDVRAHQLGQLIFHDPQPAALILDLRERAMLGDSGANLLGFAVGAQLAASLPVWSLWIAAVAIVGVNVLADTVTLSRVIEAIPPLRWFDGVGRVRPLEPLAEG